MKRVISEYQEMLIGYLSAVGCRKGAVFEIFFELAEPEDILDMLEFCKVNHGKATERDFVIAAKEISAKKKRRTIEDVWAIKNEYKFLKAMILYISIKCNEGDRLDRLNEEEKTLFMVSVFDDYIMNGNFTGFFFNSCGDFANGIIPALERIGAVGQAEICKRVFGIYGDMVPEKMWEREHIYNLLPEAIWKRVDSWENELHSGDDNLYELCYQFILNNKESFSDQN